MTARAVAMAAALSLAACSGSSELDRASGSANRASGGSAGTDAASGASAGTGGVSAGAGAPVMLPAPDAADLGAPSSDGEPLLLARGQLGPIALALDAENVYWLNRGTFESSLKDKYSNRDASVMKCARAGCAGQPTALATNRTFQAQTTLAFALDGRYVYWNDWLDEFGGGSLVRCAVGGCDLTPEPALSRAVHALVADASRLYATEFQAEVFTCSTADCENSVVDLWAAGYTPIATDVAIDVTGVYWSTAALDGVLTCPATGCNNSPSVVMPSGTGLASTLELALDADNVYVADTNPCTSGMLVACKKTGCPEGPRLLAENLDAPTSIVSDGAHLYFGEQHSGCGFAPASVSRCNVNGCDGTPETLALGFTTPAAVAVDTDFVFVADADAGAIWRLPKPKATR